MPGTSNVIRGAQLFAPDGPVKCGSVHPLFGVTYKLIHYLELRMDRFPTATKMGVKGLEYKSFE